MPAYERTGELKPSAPTCQDVQIRLLRILAQLTSNLVLNIRPSER
jgi:hypothetical protein